LATLFAAATNSLGITMIVTVFYSAPLRSASASAAVPDAQVDFALPFDQGNNPV
jgi:hypothetical protein